MAYMVGCWSEGNNSRSLHVQFDIVALGFGNLMGKGSESHLKAGTVNKTRQIVVPAHFLGYNSTMEGHLGDDLGFHTDFLMGCWLGHRTEFGSSNFDSKTASPKDCHFADVDDAHFPG